MKTKAESIVLAEHYKQQRGNQSPAAHIVAIGGGKGGVGKSFVSSNLALFFANLGVKTILVDLDLGAANAHTVLGEPQPKHSLHDFIRDPVSKSVKSRHQHVLTICR